MAEEDQGQDGGALRAKLEETIAENQRLAAENERIQRERAFEKAGLEPGSSKVVDAFVEKYDGELDTKAIVAEAKDWGLLKEETPPEPPTVTTEEREHERLAEEARTGSPGDEHVEEDPREAGRAAFEKALQTMPRDEAMAEYIRTMAGAAQRGDKRALVQ